LIPRGGFEAAVKQHKAERHARGFQRLGTVGGDAVLPIGAGKSLREITEWLQASEGKLRIPRNVDQRSELMSITIPK
jgi:hypothetical protein